MYSNTLRPPVPSADLAHLVAFNQSEFFPPGRDPGLADTGYAFIPPACRRGTSGNTTACRLHFWFHGCGGPGGFYNASVQYAGFNEWAEANDIVIVYPAMRSWGTHATPS